MKKTFVNSGQQLSWTPESFQGVPSKEDDKALSKTAPEMLKSVFV